MKSPKMSIRIKKNILFLSLAGMFAGAVACNAPQNDTGGEGTEPGTDENMYEETTPSDTTSAVDTTMTDTLDGGF